MGQEFRHCLSRPTAGVSQGSSRGVNQGDLRLGVLFQMHVVLGRIHLPAAVAHDSWVFKVSRECLLLWKVSHFWFGTLVYLQNLFIFAMWKNTNMGIISHHLCYLCSAESRSQTQVLSTLKGGDCRNLWILTGGTHRAILKFHRSQSVRLSLSPSRSKGPGFQLQWFSFSFWSKQSHVVTLPSVQSKITPRGFILGPGG